MEYFPGIKNAILESVYNDKNANYLIEDNDNSSEICAIYFSSNAIFFPETEENFDREIVHKNKFEWYNNRIGIESRSIFLRDIFKNFYVSGINSDVDSIDRLCEWIKKHTEGYKIITVGSLAGGYAALLIGMMIGAIKIFDFSGQVDLWNYFDFKNKSLLIKYKHCTERNKYYNLVDIIKNNSETSRIIYLTPSRSSEDIQQVSVLRQANDKRIKIINIKSRRHGVPIFKESLPFFFGLSEKEIENIARKDISLFRFTCNYGGVFWFTSKALLI